MKDSIRLENSTSPGISPVASGRATLNASAQESSELHKSRRFPLGRILRWTFGAIGILIFLGIVDYLVVAEFVFRGWTRSPYVQWHTSNIPFPIAHLGRGTAWYQEWMSRQKALERTQQVNAILPAATDKEQVLSQLMIDVFLRAEAERRGIRVSEAEVNDFMKKIQTASGGASIVDSVLLDQFGWDVATLREAIRTLLIRRKMETHIQLDPVLNAEMEQEAKSIAEELKQDPKQFDALVTKKSQSPDAGLGGDVGVIRKGVWEKSIDDALFDEKKEDHSIIGPIRTVDGFRILQVRNWQEDQLQAKQIVINAIDPQEWLMSQLRLATSTVMVSGYMWNSDAGRAVLETAPTGWDMVVRRVQQWGVILFGSIADERIRTSDLRVTSALLYHLSYIGTVSIVRG